MASRLHSVLTLVLLVVAVVLGYLWLHDRQVAERRELAAATARDINDEFETLCRQTVTGQPSADGGSLSEAQRQQVSDCVAERWRAVEEQFASTEAGR